VNDFVQAYGPLCQRGHDVVSIHLSAKLSGTLNSAYQARESLSSGGLTGGVGAGEIEIIDSRLTSMGLGMVVLAAAKMASQGAGRDVVVQGVKDSLGRCHCYFLLDTLEYLHKGGRIGKAKAFLGSLLSIKPILTIRDGEAHPVERTRTRARGIQRLVELASALAPAQGLSVLHSTTPAEAETLKERLSGLAPSGELVMSRFGPVVGTYLGPGALGVTLMAAP
jgi:DegV family protein with EDD domain